jgi:LuxR family maltose regulon positive regulatory protein
LAGLALRRHADPAERAAFIAAFAGSDRFVVDYLAEEVLQGQPAAVQDFLLQTSILERLCGPLCDAVLGRGTDAPPAQGMLEVLERANLFVIPLDHERRWYRFHHLFAEVLQARLRGSAAAAQGAGGMAVLHRRASDWFDQEGHLPEAIRHALAAGAFERAADLVERVVPAQFVSAIQFALPGWLGALPEGVVRTRPALAVADAWRLLRAGDLAAAGLRIEAAERALAAIPATDRVRNTRGEEAVVRAYLALWRAEHGQVTTCAEQALADLAPDNATFRGLAGLCLGNAALLQGQGEHAETAFAEAASLGRAAGAHHLAASAAFCLSVTQRVLGARRRALATARAALAWAADHRAAAGNWVDMVYPLLADLLREENDLGAAAEHAAEAVARFRRWDSPAMLRYSLLALARARQAAGDLAGALAALDEARSLKVGLAAGWTVLDACEAQVWLAQGQLAPAVRWAQQPPAAVVRSVPVVLAVAYECEHLRIAPAQVWLAQGRATADPAALEQALALLAEQGQAAAALELGWLRLKVRALEALAHAALGHDGRALALLGEAVALAEPEGHVRLFVDEGPPMAALLARLRAARPRDVSPALVAYVDRLLQALAAAASPTSPLATSTAGAAPGPPAAAGPVEPLSGRELEVLRLLAAGLTNQEIASELIVSLSTARTHVRHIFDKLAVNNRRAAGRLARELRLL